MGKKHLLRFGLASMLAGSVGLGGVLAACGDDEGSSSGGTNTPDTGTGSETGTPDTGGGDTGTPDTGVDAGPPLAKLTLVNAAVDIGPSNQDDAEHSVDINKAARIQAVRICFKTGTNEQNLSVAPYPPLPREAPPGTPAGTPPGLYMGTGGAFPSFGLDLEGRILQPIIFNAKELARRGFIKPTDGGVEKVCDELLDPAKTTGLTEGVDYFTLDVIPAGTFKKDKSYLLGLTGCSGNATQTAGATSICGPDFQTGAGKGNLKVNILEVTRAASGADQGIQVAHLSSPYQIIPGQVRPFTPGFTNDPTAIMDAGAYRNAVATPGTVDLNKISAVKVMAITDDDYFASNQQPASATPPITVTAPIPLTAIQALSGLGKAEKPTVYVKGKNFVFVSIGDPTVPSYLDGTGAPSTTPSANFNLRSYHYLAFPTDPTIQMYKP